jgi:uncharacterized membrane protein HdeD (DUF308 family)
VIALSQRRRTKSFGFRFRGPQATPDFIKNEATPRVEIAMTSTTGNHTPHHPSLGLQPLRAKWGWIVALGVIYVIVGLVALGSIVTATAASVLVVGIMMVVAGVAEVFNAFQIKTWGKFVLWLLLGALYILAGIATFENPVLAAALLTLLLGAALVASGIMRIILAFSMKESTPWIWVVVSGAITLILGLVILARWPVSSLYVLGLFLGIDLVIAGASWIGIGLDLRARNWRPT